MDAGRSLKREKDVDTATFHLLANTDDALRYITYVMFDRLHVLILNYKFYLEGKEWAARLKDILKRGQVSQFFRNMLNLVPAVFNVTRPSPH